MSSFLLALLPTVLLLPQRSLSGLAVPKGGDENPYDRAFFEQHASQRDAHSALADILAAQMGLPTSSPPSSRPVSVVDVGCGHGLLVEALRTRGGGLEAHCLEGSSDAVGMWPPEQVARGYYVRRDLASDGAVDSMPATDYVATFEVAEHLPPSAADRFVSLLVAHRPRKVFFGAATINQDLGRNPTHVNENTLRYWVKKFEERGYLLDAVTTAAFRRDLMRHPLYAVGEAWWYAKNALVFVDGGADDPSSQQGVTLKLRLDMRSSHAGARRFITKTSNAAGKDLFGAMWRRDWNEFLVLFDERRSNLLGDNEM